MNLNHMIKPKNLLFPNTTSQKALQRVISTSPHYINLDEEYCAGLAIDVHCRHDSLPLSFLGMALGSNPKRISTWKPVIFKFRSRLSLWKGKLLSMVGRLCLIKSVIMNSLPLYFSLYF